MNNLQITLKTDNFLQQITDAARFYENHFGSWPVQIVLGSDAMRMFFAECPFGDPVSTRDKLFGVSVALDDEEIFDIISRFVCVKFMGMRVIGDRSCIGFRLEGSQPKLTTG